MSRVHALVVFQASPYRERHLFLLRWRDESRPRGPTYEENFSKPLLLTNLAKFFFLQNQLLFLKPIIKKINIRIQFKIYTKMQNKELLQNHANVFIEMTS